MSEIYNKYLPFAKQDDLIERIKSWNIERNGLEFDPALEIKMITEEVIELMNATNLPNALKELCDIMFVAMGTIAKDTEDVLEDWMRATFKMVEVLCTDPNYLISEMDPDYEAFFEVCIAIVVEANEKKGTVRDADGKVIKGPDYVNPEHIIKQLLEEMRIGY